MTHDLTGLRDELAEGVFVQALSVLPPPSSCVRYLFRFDDGREVTRVLDEGMRQKLVAR